MWGEAYQQNPPTYFSLQSFGSKPDYHSSAMDHFAFHDYHDSVFHALVNNGTRKGTFGIEWPNAAEHPFFYVGIYGAIGLSSAFVGVLSALAQYTGAIRASRKLFKWASLF